MVKQLIAETLFELKTVTNPTLSADGQTAIIVVTEMDKEKNDYIANLHAFQPASKGDSVQITYGNHKNVSPKWAPVGDKLAFLSNRSGKMQLYVKGALAEPKQVTDEPQGVASYEWASNGEMLAYAALSKEEEQDSENHHPQPVVIDKMKYKSDARGLLDSSLMQITVIHLNEDVPKRLTDALFDVQLLGFSADSSAVLVAGDRSENRDFSFSTDVWFIDIETLVETAVTEQPIALSGAAVSSDGQHIALLGHYREYENATLPSLYVVNLQNRTISHLTKQVDVVLGDVAIGDFLQNNGANQLMFSEDGSSIYTLVSSHGHVNLWSYHLDGKIEKHTSLQGHMNGYSVINEQVVVTYSDVSKPSEAYTLDLSTKSLIIETSFNADVEAAYELSTPESIRLERGDGSFVEGWLMKPTSFCEDTKYPLVLEVHGGPHAMYAKTYFHEFQMLTARGYAVLFTNPRGGHGYGQAFVDAVRGDYGGGDFKDLMDMLDYTLEENNWIDEQRLGITGGSYGGFMTNWAVGHTNRFKAAVTQRSISNWISFYGVSDIGYYFSDWQMKADLTDIETLWKHSPLKYVSEVETPLLILHGENDLRCPIEQAEQLFIALKKQGKETQFIRFPEANHELSRSGKPNLRMERLHAIANWFDHYL